MKDKTILLNWILAISLSISLFSCHKEPTKFQWQPAISAPKFYPVAGLADFGNAGHRSGTAFDNGWGDQYGGVVSGSKYKEVPEEVYISYFSVVDGLEYSGKVQLPYDRLLQLFREQTVEKNPTIRLKVGMAPGGWIRVWFYSSKDGNIEIAKAQLKGIREDPTVGIALRSKTFEYWGGTYTYWQHHGIPYEAWANNEKEYTLYFDLEKPNKREIGMSYVSLDGTFYQNIINDQYNYNKKLPARIELCWINTNSNQGYCCQVDLPKKFQKLVEEQKSKEVTIRLEIEKDEEHGVLYWISNNQKIKIVRFKNIQPTEKEIEKNNYGVSPEIEYFIK